MANYSIEDERDITVNLEDMQIICEMKTHPLIDWDLLDHRPQPVKTKLDKFEEMGLPEEILKAIAFLEKSEQKTV